MRSFAAAAAFSVVAAAPATHQVAIRDNSFDPPAVTVATGDTITWTNRGQRVHTVAVEGEVTSGPIQPGATHSDTFNTPGTRAYRCEIHGGMEGTIVVQGAAVTTTSSSTTTTVRRAQSTTTTTADPLGSSITAPPDSTTTSSSVVEETTTTSAATATGADESARGATDTGSGDGEDDVDVPSAVAALLLLVTAGGALAQTRGRFR